MTTKVKLIGNDAVGAAQIAANALGINDLSNATVNSSDPTKTTNPSSGVGSLWINSTSGFFNSKSYAQNKKLLPIKPYLKNFLPILLPSFGVV